MKSHLPKNIIAKKRSQLIDRHIIREQKRRAKNKDPKKDAQTFEDFLKITNSEPQ